MTPALPSLAQAAAASRMRRVLDTGRPRLLLVAFCLLLWLPGLFLVPASDRDESRFAQATKQMLETGDFVAIRNGTEARNRKPIGIYWLQAPGAAIARATGIAMANPVWPYRLPSLVGGLVAVLATWSIGCRLFGLRAGLLAGMMLAASVLLTVETAIAKTDAALLGATTLAMAVLAEAWIGGKPGRGRAALFWLAMGVGILLKGPITPMVAGFTALALVLTDRRAVYWRWLAVLRPGWGIPLMLLVVLPWFVAIGIATHGQFFRDAVGGDLAGKLAGGDDAHGAPPGYHLLLLSVTLFPAAPIVLAALPAAWRARRQAAVRFLLAWIVPAWIVFEAVPTKLPHYPLPLFPALCLLGAGWVCGALGDGDGSRWVRRGALGLFAIAAAGIGVAAAAGPVLLDHGFSLLGVPALAASGLVLWLGLRKGPDGRSGALAATLVAMPLLTWAMFGLELPNATSLWIAPRVEAALRAHGPRGGFAAVGYAEPSLMFVCGTDTQMLSGGEAGAAFLAGAPGRIVLVDSGDRASFLAAAAKHGVSPHAFGEIDGFNYSKGKPVALTLYDAAW